MGVNVLVVDDSCTMRQMVRRALESDGHRVTEGDHGQSALRALSAGPVDLVITDVNMPVMDGLSLTRAIRKLDRYRFTPILILTTERTYEMKQQGRAAGATGWMVKPFNPDQLRQIVHRVLGPTRSGA